MKRMTKIEILKEYIKGIIWERKWLKQKPCAACKYMYHYMGSAIICEAQKGCPLSRMKDHSDFCDCGKYKKRRNYFVKGWSRK